VLYLIIQKNEQQYTTVARKSTIGGFYLCPGRIKNENLIKLHCL